MRFTFFKCKTIFPNLTIEDPMQQFCKSVPIGLLVCPDPPWVFDKLGRLGGDCVFNQIPIGCKMVFMCQWSLLPPPGHVEGQDVIGDVLPSKYGVSSRAACQRECLVTSVCMAYSYQTTSETCNMYSTVSSTIPAAGYSVGMAFENLGCFITNSDYNGGDITSTEN